MRRSLEVFYLPSLFLTVVLLGGVRVAGRVVFVAPALSALVLGILLLTVLVRCGAVAPERLMNGHRSAWANVSGAVLLLTLFAAAVQAFNAVTPDTGLPRIAVDVFLFVLLVNTLAALPDRAHVLRSLAVTFGSMFVLKFIVLSALSDPAGGWVKRLLLATLEGATLGTLTQPFLPIANGYVAFATIVLFLTGTALLPPREGESRPFARSQLEAGDRAMTRSRS